MTANRANGDVFTWEEVSWITGIPIVNLIEMFSDGMKANGVDVSDLPPTVDGHASAQWLTSHPGLVGGAA